jgi:cephalosporin-C deacetylase-like acetyl esterase
MNFLFTRKSKRLRSSAKFSTSLIFAFLLPLVGFAQGSVAELWTDEIMARIRDPQTLNLRIIPRLGYFEVFYDSEIGEASWAESLPPYQLHQGDSIRIHGYLATPLVGGPYPGIVIGHGHQSKGSAEVAKAVASFGYVALSIDGPRAGQSTGGPEDTGQAWISVEEAMNLAAPQYSYLYHYAYAGMRGLTLLESLAGLRFLYPNPLRIDRDRLGVIGASMGGILTYYLNGIDSRIKAAVAIAAAGDWHKLLFYPGSWLYHGLYYYTRDGLPSQRDDLNTISDVCLDPTLSTFLTHFDPIQYAPRQHGPLLTILGTHDQYFALPAINTTYNRTASAGTNQRFQTNILLNPNGKHGLLRSEDDFINIVSLIQDVHAWFQYAFYDRAKPPATPTIAMEVENGEMVFQAAVTGGTEPISNVTLYFATQVDTFPEIPNDFATLRLQANGTGYAGRIPIGAQPPAGPPAIPENVLYYVSVRDNAGFTISSKAYLGSAELDFCNGFVPQLEHWPRDSFPVQPPPIPDCHCTGNSIIPPSF